MNVNDFQDVYIDRIDIKAALTGSLYNDPPLLQELGINFQTIKQESFLIFNPKTDIENSDITGPIIFTFLYSFFLLLSGKVHFGYVYFITLTSNLLVYFLLNVMKNTHRSIDLAKCFSVLGYSFVPVVGFAFINVCCTWFSFVGYFAAVWSCYIASVVFCRYLEMEDRFFLVMYPVLLIYVCYVLLVIF